MKCAELNYDLVRKYNLPVPRYTSYPTVPFWNNDMNAEKWQNFFVRRFHEQNHTVEEEYLLAIEKEWKLYRKFMRQTPVIRELHLGGGTPTFFSSRNLKRL